MEGEPPPGLPKRTIRLSSPHHKIDAALYGTASGLKYPDPQAQEDSGDGLGGFHRRM